nr:hypothetical protein B456_010G225900 [Gossypium raimondii]
MEHLEELCFQYCESTEEMKMEKLSTSINYAPCFPTLNRVSILNCNKLTDVTWLILAPNLRFLSIYGCAKMEEILSEEKLGEVTDVVGIPNPKPFMKLETLDLGNLPELKSIYWDTLPFPCLKTICLWWGCPKLEKLPLNSHTTEGNQVTILGREDWWATIEWENEATAGDAFLPSFRTVFK